MAEAPAKSSREKSSKSGDKDDKSKTHKLSLKGMWSLQDPETLLMRYRFFKDGQ